MPVDVDDEPVYNHALHCTVGRSSNVILKGYYRYATLNGKHNPAQQSVRTLKTFSKASIKSCQGVLASCKPPCFAWAMAT